MDEHVTQRDPLIALGGPEDGAEEEVDGTALISLRQWSKDDWAPAFFRAWLETNLVYKAAEIAGITRIRVWQRRQTDAQFAETYSDIEERGTQLLEQVAVRRAVEGSDGLLTFMLRARRPNLYRENVRVEHEHSGHISLGVSLLDGAQPVDIDSKTRREAARLLQGEIIEGVATDVVPD